MKRWQWIPLLVLAGVAAAAVAVLPFRGGDNTSRTLAQAAPLLQIDMIQDAGGTWCNPVDTSTTHAQGDNYQVAVCLTDAPTELGGFQFYLDFDDVLNTCVPLTTGSNLDQNPDANAGTTKFNGTESAPNGLGTGWDCNLGGVAPPSCAQGGAGHAFLQCNTVIGTLDLPVGVGVSEPIALVRFIANAQGTDTLSLQNVSLIDVDTNEFLACDTQSHTSCTDATDDKTGQVRPTNTPTLTPVPPTATNTPCPDGICPTRTPTPRPLTSTPSPGPTDTATPAPGQPTSPPPPPPPPPSGGPGPVVVPPSTGQGSGMPWTAPLAAIIAGLGAASLISTGLFVRLARRR